MMREAAMPVWVVKATWIEDEAEASERWEVKAATAQDAIREVTKHLRFPAHHIEASRHATGPGQGEQASALQPGQARRLASS